MPQLEKIKEKFLACNALANVDAFFHFLDPNFESFTENNSLFINISEHEFIELYVFTEKNEIERRAKQGMGGRLCQLAISKDFENWYFARQVMEERLRVVKYRIEKDKIRNGKGSVALQRLEQLRYGKSDTFYELFDRKDVSKRFYSEYTKKRQYLIKHIKGIKDKAERQLYAQVLLDRIIFLYFLQKKNLMDEDERYLAHRFKKYEKSKESFYRKFLRPLFFDTICCKPEKRKKESIEITGEKIPYLNGGLFLRHPLEEEYTAIDVDNEGFKNVLTFFESWIWNVSEGEGAEADEIDPYILGYIFENSLGENKSTGSYYTPPFLSGFLTQNTIQQHLLDYIEEVFKTKKGQTELRSNTKLKSYTDLELYIQEAPEGELLHFYEKLRGLALCDPACGSGQFLVEALQVLAKLHEALHERASKDGLSQLAIFIQKDYPAAQGLEALSQYEIRRLIVSQNLYGIDLNEEAVEITKLRLFLGMCNSIQDNVPEPLPNIDYKIRAGDALTGLLRFSDADVYKIKDTGKNSSKDKHRDSYKEQRGMGFGKSKEILSQREKLIFEYQNCHSSENALKLRHEIDELGKKLKDELDKKLNTLIESLSIRPKSKIDFIDLEKDSTAKKRLDAYRLSAKELAPLHYDLEFSQVIEKKTGFDILLLNPPWEAWKPNSQEFFETRWPDFRKLNKNEAKRKVSAYLKKDKKAKEQWINYNCYISALSSFFRQNGLYEKQDVGDTNLYKLFLERSYRLLNESGSLGIVMPSGFYSDAGCTELRREFLEKSKINFLYGFENRKGIFENVDSRFKFILFSLSRGQKTQGFPAAFMLQREEELDKAHRAEEGKHRVELTNKIIQKLNSQSLSFMEFKSQLDINIAEKMSRFPLLEEELKGKWQPKFASGFHMTGKAHLFRKEAELKKIGARYATKTQSYKDKKGNLYFPLYEGKMIWQYDSYYERPQYWVKESEGAAVFPKKNAAKTGKDEVDLPNVLKSVKSKQSPLPYQNYRLSFRDVSRNTDKRTWIVSLLPANTFSGNSVQHLDNLSSTIILFFTALAGCTAVLWVMLKLLLSRYYPSFPINRYCVTV